MYVGMSFSGKTSRRLCVQNAYATDFGLYLYRTILGMRHISLFFFLDPDLFFFLRCSQMEKGTWSSGFPLCGEAKLARVLPVASLLLFSL